MKKIIFLNLFILFSVSVFAQTGSLKITITDIESNDGNIKVALFDQYNSEGFLKKIDLAYQKKELIIKNKNTGVTFTDIPYGTYAVSLFHDKNNNGEIDRSSIGFPIEPYGVSGNKIVIGPPKFNDCKFKINASFKTINIVLKNFL